jgi:trigger factor
MNLTFNRIDAVNATVTVTVAKTDYQPAVEKSINELRRKAIVPGFRKGMVPQSRIWKMYGKSLIQDEIKKLAVNRLSEYIRDEKLNVLGDALIDENQQPVDIDTVEDCTIVFNIGLTPEINLTIDKKDKLPYYEIKIPDEMIDSRIESYRASLGEYSKSETVEEKNLIKGVLTELDKNGNPEPNGISIENSMLMPVLIKDKTEREKIIGAKLNTTVVFNPFKAYEGNETELASLLRLEKEKVKYHTSDFSLQINNIDDYKKAEVNQAFFDRVCGPDQVKTVEEFRQKIAENISKQFILQSENKFLIDVVDFLKKKAGKITFPEVFLKRLIMQNTKESPEKQEEKFPDIIENLQTRLIKEKIIKDYDIKVEEDEVEEAAKATILAQFAQYGITSVSDEIFEEYLKKMLQSEETISNLIDRVLEIKFSNVMKAKLTLDYKSVSVEEFQKLIGKKTASAEKKTAKRTTKKTVKAEKPEESKSAENPGQTTKTEE